MVFYNDKDTVKYCKECKKRCRRTTIVQYSEIFKKEKYASNISDRKAQNMNHSSYLLKSSSLPNYYSKSYIKSNSYQNKITNRYDSMNVGRNVDINNWMNTNTNLFSEHFFEKSDSYSQKRSIDIICGKCNTKQSKIDHAIDVTTILNIENEDNSSSHLSIDSINSETSDQHIDNNSKIKAMKECFTGMKGPERNKFLGEILSVCDVSEIHFLSMKMEYLMHKGCPSFCSNYIDALPDAIIFDIFKLLDPVSLARAGRVCRRWRRVACDPLLWRALCQRDEWSINTAISSRSVHPTSVDIKWNEAFAERFRLRRNWLTGKCLIRTFEGHTQYISCLQFDGIRIVSGSSDKTIRVWDIRTNSKWSVQTLNGHSGTVRCLALNGNRLVSGSSDMSIKVWDLSNEDSWSSIACKVTMTGHTGMVRCLQVDDEKVVSGSYDRSLKVWDLKTGVCTMTLSGHTEAVLCLQFDDEKLVSGSHDNTIKIWRLTDGVCITTLDSHQGAVTCLHFTSLPDQLISGSLDCTIKFWCLKRRQCIHTIDWKDSEGHTGVIRCIQADKWRIVSASDDGTIKMWDLENGRRLVTLKNHSDGVTCLQFNDRLIVSGSYDKTVKLWDFNC